MDNNGKILIGLFLWPAFMWFLGLVARGAYGFFMAGWSLVDKL